MSKTRKNCIRKVREKLGFSGTAVAEKLGVSPQYYYDLETGRRRLNVDHIIQLADLFDVSTDHLLGRSTENIVGETKYADLPEIARKEIEDFVEFVRLKYKA